MATVDYLTFLIEKGTFHIAKQNAHKTRYPAISVYAYTTRWILDQYTHTFEYINSYSSLDVALSQFVDWPHSTLLAIEELISVDDTRFFKYNGAVARNRLDSFKGNAFLRPRSCIYNEWIQVYDIVGSNIKSHDKKSVLFNDSEIKPYDPVIEFPIISTCPSTETQTSLDEQRHVSLL
jgi:hypothetical protein